MLAKVSVKVSAFILKCYYNKFIGGKFVMNIPPFFVPFGIGNIATIGF